MRFLLLVFALAGCKDSEATCLGQHLPDGGGGHSTCDPGPNCAPCWSCQDFGVAPGWKLLPGTCDAPPLVSDAPGR